MDEKITISLKTYLDDRFKNVDDSLKGINEHLKILNGQTAKNTAFRNRSIGITIGITSVMGCIFTVAGLLINFIV